MTNQAERAADEVRLEDVVEVRPDAAPRPSGEVSDREPAPAGAGPGRPARRPAPAADALEEDPFLSGEDEDGDDLDPAAERLRPGPGVLMFYYAGKVADAMIGAYSRAFRFDPRYLVAAHRTKGLEHARRGRWEKAIPFLERVLLEAPDDLPARRQLVKAYGATRQHRRAAFHLEQILAAQPRSADALRALGILAARDQDYRRAVEYLERAAAADPEHAETRYRLGMARGNLKEHEAAVEAFREAIRLEPRFAKAYQALGFTYEGLGRREEAVDCFKKALELE